MIAYTYQLVMTNDPERCRLAKVAVDTLTMEVPTMTVLEPAVAICDELATSVGFSKDRLTPEQRGCAFGHRKIHRDFVKNCPSVGNMTALALEDDIVIQDIHGLVDVIRQFSISFGQSEHAPASVVQLEERNRPWEPEIEATGRLSPEFPFIHYKGPRWGTVAYLMNLPAAKILVDRPLDAVADAWPKEGIDYYAPPKGANIITTDHCQSHIKSGNWDRVTITPAGPEGKHHE